VVATLAYWLAMAVPECKAALSKLLAERKAQKPAPTAVEDGYTDQQGEAEKLSVQQLLRGAGSFLDLYGGY
jgi:hypothetical protein